MISSIFMYISDIFICRRSIYTYIYINMEPPFSIWVFFGFHFEQSPKVIENMRPFHISRLQWRALLEGSWGAPTFIHPGNVVNIKIADKWWMDVHPNMALWLLTHTHLPFIPFILPTFEPPEVERVPRMALLKREGRAAGPAGSTAEVMVM